MLLRFLKNAIPSAGIKEETLKAFQRFKEDINYIGIKEKEKFEVKIVHSLSKTESEETGIAHVLHFIITSYQKNVILISFKVQNLHS